MAKTAVDQWDTTASNNTDINSIPIDGAVTTPSQVDNIFREMMAQIKTYSLKTLKGHLHGLTLSNNGSDATNDIDIAAGEAASTETSPVLMVLASALTKRLDAAWAVGTGNGGLDTGAIANTTYHVWLIQRSDTGVVDALFSASATAPTMPANYDRKRRLGAILRVGGTILQFRQSGDRFTGSATNDRNSTSTAASALLALTVPLGIIVRPIIRLKLQVTGADIANSFGDAASGVASIQVQNVQTGVSDTNLDITVIDSFYTNTSAQIYFACAGTGTINANLLTTLGWVDARGKEA